MGIVYIKNWCGSRHFTGGKSDHSLDVETISLLDGDVAQAEPMINLFSSSNKNRKSVASKKDNKPPRSSTEEGSGGVGVGVTKPSNTFRPK